MRDTDISEKYLNLFEHNPNFQKEYLSHKRIRFYQKIVSIIKELRLKSIFDISGGYEFLCEEVNIRGVYATGFELTIDN